MSARFVLMAILVASTPVVAADPFPGNLTGIEVGTALPAGYEPSGAAWHPRHDYVYVCSDGGTVSRMRRDGSQVVNRSLDGNWEGVAIADPQSEFVLLVDENTGRVREYQFIAATLGREFDLTTASAASGVTPLNAADLDALVDGGDGSGVEALAFVPNRIDPSNGELWAGSQENGFVYRFRLPATGNAVSYLGKLRNWKSTSLQALEYDWQRGGRVLGLGSGLIFRVDVNGVLDREWNSVSGSNQEGLALENCCLFVAFDPAAAHSVKRHDAFDIDPAAAMFANGFE